MSGFFGSRSLRWLLLAFACFAAIAVFLLDLLVRRVRIFDRKFVPKGGPRSRRAPMVS